MIRALPLFLFLVACAADPLPLEGQARVSLLQADFLAEQIALTVKDSRALGVLSPSVDREVTQLLKEADKALDEAHKAKKDLDFLTVDNKAKSARDLFFEIRSKLPKEALQ